MHLSPHHSNPLLSFPALSLSSTWHAVFYPLTTFIFFPPLCLSHFLGPRLHLPLRILMKTRSRDAPNKVLQCWLPQFKPPLICCLLSPHNTMARFLTSSLNCYTICIHSLKCNPICSFPLSLELSLHTTHPQLSTMILPHVSPGQWLLFTRFHIEKRSFPPVLSSSCSTDLTVTGLTLGLIKRNKTVYNLIARLFCQCMISSAFSYMLTC